MQRTIGVDKARAKLGQLAEEVAAEDEAVVLTRRGEALAVLLSPSEYERLIEISRRAAHEELRARLARVRQSVADAGLDVSVVDEAIAAAQRLPVTIAQAGLVCSRRPRTAQAARTR
jgi:prevent-host-death family protein